jgi:hypothetical protein
MTESRTEGKFLLSARFLKKKNTNTNVSEKISRNIVPNVSEKIHRKIIPNPSEKISRVFPKSEALTLLQKSEKARTTTTGPIDPLATLQETANKMAADQHRSENPDDPAPIDLNIGTGPIWITGWIKYFKYYPSMKTQNLTPINTPRQFMINPQFNEQLKLYPNYDKKEQRKNSLGKELNLYIADKYSFYAKLLKDQILILSSRNVNKYIYIF